MNQRTLLLIAAGLTAFVLALAGGLVSRMSAATATAPQPTIVAVPDTAQTTLDPTIEALIREREAAYQAALADANARLNDANAQIATNNQPATQPALAYDGSAETAATIAFQYRGGGEVREVELETEDGLTVYEVKFTDDAEVYIDAQTGQVVYADLAEAAPNADDDDDED